MRKAIPSKARFEVFKRDGFACQYCGRTPPDVVLQVDHIHPVSKGGDNEEGNLVTACFDCNIGKSDRLLDVSPASLAAKAEVMIEKAEQLKAYERLRKAERARVERGINRLLKIFKEANPDFKFAPVFRTSIKENFLSRLAQVDVEDAMRISVSAGLESSEATIKYFCGVCWNRIKGGNRRG